MSTDCQDDPGRRWRILVFAGAIFTILTVVARFVTVGSFLEAIRDAHRSALKPTPAHVIDYFGALNVWLVLPATVLFPISLLLGPVAIAVSRRVGKTTRSRLLRTYGLIFYSLLALNCLFYYGLKQLRPSESDWVIVGILACLLSILLAGGISLVEAWRHRSTATGQFWGGLPAFALWQVASISLLFGELFIYLRHGATLTATYFSYSISGLIGACIILLGWLMWWRAVARHERERAAAAKS